MVRSVIASLSTLASCFNAFRQASVHFYSAVGEGGSHFIVILILDKCLQQLSVTTV